MTVATDAQFAAARVLVAVLGADSASISGVASIPGAITVSLSSRDADPVMVELNTDGTINEVRISRDLGHRGREIHDQTNQPLGDQLRAALTAQKDQR